MSDAFQDREKGFERKYELDQDQQFRAQSRRDRLFGQWAAGKLGLSGPDADAYAREVVAANFEKPGDDDMIGKVKADFAAKHVAVEDSEIRRALVEVAAEAARQIATEAKA